MYQMEKITTGVSYTTSAVGTGYWFLQLLDRVSPSQWAAIGVLGSLLFGLLTYLTNLYFKIREDRRKAECQLRPAASSISCNGTAVPC
ncbi:lysis protein S [Shigella sonnei]|uniref:class II holin family protein n=1 Tax=Shigella sonnei TaxID=624 RepID=UPI000972F8D8|nr:class II holin family protein [Shigella sonnei]SJH33780.1 lysis protein S [Shigella sonnei]